MLRINKITKAFKNFELSEISLNINRGDYFVLIGKSGSGKSLILEIIAGIQKADSGDIVLNEKNIVNTKTQNRNCLLVYPDNTLFPHLSVYENIAFSLKSKRFNKKVIKEKISEISDYFSITHLLHRKPDNLSSGEAQRVALARALVLNPDVLLLDEPLSSLDVMLKTTMISLLRKINKAGQTIVHVTHDFEEAVSLSNTVAVIDEGKIIQIGSSEHVFNNPENKFVAELSGLKNFYHVSLGAEKIDGLRHAEVIHSNVVIKIISDSDSKSGYIAFGSKDVFVSETNPETSAVNKFKGIVKDILKSGLGYEIIVDIGITVCVAISKSSINDLNINLGKELWVGFKASACRYIENN